MGSVAGGGGAGSYITLSQHFEILSFTHGTAIAKHEQANV